MDQEVPLLVVLDERLHPEMNFDERIKATMTLQQVHLETNCAERNENKKEEEEGVGEDLRLDGLAEGPPLHLGLEPHVGDLQAEAVPVHGGGVGVGFAWDEGWPIIDWERRRLVAPARPPTGFPRPFLLLWTRHWWQHLLRVLISSELILVRPI